MIASVPMPGRTRWAMFDPHRDVFCINIAEPAHIVVLEASDPTHIAATYRVPAAGPHGLDLDVATERLFCACDAQQLVCLASRSGTVLAERALSGVPDVIFLHARLGHLYVAIGEPGLIDVFETTTLARLATMQTEQGAHTIALDVDRDKVYAFLPQSHRAAVYVDTGA